MTRSPKNLSAEGTFLLLRDRGIANPQDEVVRALCDGALIASGKVAKLAHSHAGWHERIPAAWWRHLSGQIEENVAYFAPAETDPTTPFRVAEVEFARDAIDIRWPVSEAIAKEPKAEPRMLTMRRGRPRGPRPNKLDATVRKITDEIGSGALARERLDAMKEEEMATRWDVSRDTARKARARVLAELPPSSGAQENSTNSDK